MSRLARRSAAVLAFAFVLVGLLAGPASAHAALQGTDPGANAVLQAPPRAVTLTFDEHVEVALGGVRVFDSRGDRLESGQPEHPGGNGAQVRVGLPHLRDDTYVVTWRVTSADSHPVRGAFTFTVGNPQLSNREVQGLAARLLSSEGGDTAVGAFDAVARFVVFAGLALLVGGVGMLVSVWPEGRGSVVARRLVWTGLWAALLGTLAGFALQGPYAAALGLGDALKPSLWSDVFATRYGKVLIARAVLLVVAMPLVTMLLPRRGPAVEHPLPGWWTAAVAVIGAALVTTPALAGHASTGPLVPLAVPADAAHVAGMALWLGGLVMLLLAVLPRADSATLREVVPRYSQVALMSVSIIVVTGVFQAFRQIDRLGALLDTDYGRLLTVKVSVFLLLVIAAAVSRDAVNRRWRIPEEEFERVPVAVGVGVGGEAPVVGGPTGPPAGSGSGGDTEADDEPYPEGFVLDERTARRRLRGALFVEVAFAVVILAVTALLVNAAPVRGSESGPFVGTLKAGNLLIDTALSPGKRGTNDLHLTALTAGGSPTDVVDMSAQLSLPSRGIAPIPVTLIRLGPGHYASNAFTVPITGDWSLTVKVTVTDIDESTATATVKIR